MKKILLIPILAIVFFACKKDNNSNSGGGSGGTNTIPHQPTSPSSNQITIISSDCGYINRTYNLTPYDADCLAASNVTSITLKGDSIPVLGFEVNIKSLGQVSTKDNFMNFFSIQTTQLSSKNCPINDVPGYNSIYGDSIIINFTRFDNPGGLIEGTFSGKIGGLNVENFQTYFINVSGKFSVTRGADQ